MSNGKLFAVIVLSNSSSFILQSLSFLFCRMPREFYEVNCDGDEYSIDECRLSKTSTCRYVSYRLKSHIQTSVKSMLKYIMSWNMIFANQTLPEGIQNLKALLPIFTSREDPWSDGYHGYVALKCGGKANSEEEKICPTVAQTSAEIKASIAECGDLNWFVCEAKPEIVYSTYGWCMKPKWSKTVVML